MSGRTFNDTDDITELQKKLTEAQNSVKKYSEKIKNGKTDPKYHQRLAKYTNNYEKLQEKIKNMQTSATDDVVASAVDRFVLDTNLEGSVYDMIGGAIENSIEDFSSKIEEISKGLNQGETNSDISTDVINKIKAGITRQKNIIEDAQKKYSELEEKLNNLRKNFASVAESNLKLTKQIVSNTSSRDALANVKKNSEDLLEIFEEFNKENSQEIKKSTVLDEVDNDMKNFEKSLIAGGIVLDLNTISANILRDKSADLSEFMSKIIQRMQEFNLSTDDIWKISDLTKESSSTIDTFDKVNQKTIFEVLLNFIDKLIDKSGNVEQLESKLKGKFT